MNNMTNDEMIRSMPSNSPGLEQNIVTGLPSLVIRIKAFFIDILIMLGVFIIASLLIDSIGDVHDFVKGGVAVGMFIFYDPLLTSFQGGTLGHRLMGLRVKKFSNSNTNISLFSAVIRLFVKTSLGWISFLTVTSSKNKRAIHDIISGSIVLRRQSVFGI